MLLDRELVYEALPAYRLGRELGRGGFGVVFAGRHRQLDRDVAVKILPRAFGADPDVRRRFVAEARVVASFDHPHIVKVHDFVEHEGVCAIVMERLETDDAGQRALAGRLGVDGVVALGVAVADALAYAHDRLVLHRDVKPENVLFTSDAVPKITDFGLARALASHTVLTGSGHILGSPAYMAPEAILGDELGTASDVYSLGVMLYELLVGRLPFAGSTSPASLAYRHVHEPTPRFPPAAAVPELVAAEVVQALAKEPADRQPSAAAMCRGLLAAGEMSFGPGWLDRCPVRVAGPARSSGPIAAAAPEAAGAPAAEQPRPRANLPAQVTSFVGREEDLAALEAAAAQARVVTLTGVGGVGKTRLAMEGAARLAPRYEDGAWLVELVGVAEPEAVTDVVASAVRVGHRQGESIRTSLLNFLQNRRLLLLLDNCEHLLEACAELVDDIVHACPQVTVLITSQRPLGIAGERLLVVPPLGLPRLGDDCREVASAPSVRLFSDRASSVRAGFQVTDRNAAAVAELCRHLDGIPLALELAAARVRAMTPEEIAARLGQRFKLLTSGRHGDRHQTLQATVDWSHSFLDDAERMVLRRVSVFAGGFGLSAAEAVASGEHIDAADVVDLLARLVDRSLLLAEDDLGATRFSLLETIRHYARERLTEAGEHQAALRRHAEYYAEFVEAAGHGLRGPDEMVWAWRFRRELDNLRAAVAWAADAGEAELALRLVVGAQAHPGTSAFVAATTLAERTRGMPGLDRQPLFPALLTCAAWGALLRGDLAEAARLARDAMAREQALGTQPDPLTRRVLGLAAISEGRVEESCRWSEDALATARRVGRPEGLTFSLAALALALCLGGDAERAVPLGEEAVDIARRLGSPTVVAYALSAYGYAQSIAEPDVAVAALEEAVKLAETVGSQTLRGQALSIQGRTQLFARQPRAALERLGEAIDDLHRLGHRPLLSAALARLAATLVQVGQFEAAAVALGASDARPSPYLADPVDQAAIADAVTGLVAALGADRVSDLRASGSKLNDDEVAVRVNAAVKEALVRSGAGRANG